MVFRASAELFEEEGLRAADRVLAVRALVVPISLALNVYLGYVAGYPNTRPRVPILSVYTLVAVSLFVAARLWPVLRRRSWLALPLVDLPCIFLAQYWVIIKAPERGPLVAAFTLSVFVLSLIAAQLSLRRRYIIPTLLMAAVLEAALLVRADRAYVMFDAIVVLVAATILVRYLAYRHLRLLERALEEGSLIERLERLKGFFSPQLAQAILRGGTEDPRKSHRRDITVVFLDLRGFTAFAATSEPEEVMGVLHEYHTEMGKLVMAHEGTLERFTGDGMMIFFNDPVPVDDPVERALRMAVAMRERMTELIRRWRKLGYELGMGIGLAQGYATIGAIGFEGRWDYAAIGTVTNLAARLCSEAKSGQILISRRVLVPVEDMVDAEPLGELTLKGFQSPITAYNVRGLKC
jgi:class 3 adenylate cyclase